MTVEKKKKFLVFQFESTASCPLAGYWWEESGFIFFTTPIRYFYALIRWPWTFPFPELMPALSSTPPTSDNPIPWTGVLLGSLQYIYLLCWGVKNWAQHTIAEQRGRVTALNLLVLMLVFFAVRAHCWLRVTPEPHLFYSTKLLCSLSDKPWITTVLFIFPVCPFLSLSFVYYLGFWDIHSEIRSSPSHQPLQSCQS